MDLGRGALVERFIEGIGRAKHYSRCECDMYDRWNHTFPFF